HMRTNSRGLKMTARTEPMAARMVGSAAAPRFVKIGTTAKICIEDSPSRAGDDDSRSVLVDFSRAPFHQLLFTFVRRLSHCRRNVCLHPGGGRSHVADRHGRAFSIHD